MAKILMVNLPYAGHTNPTLPLAKKLVAKGHHVDYVNAPHMKESIEQTGAKFIPYQNYTAPKGSQREKKECIYALYNTVIGLNEKYDLLIYEFLFYLGNQLAKKLNISCVRQFSQPAWNENSMRELKKESRLIKFSGKIVSRLMLSKQKANKLGIEKTSLIESVLYDNPNLNILYFPKELQPSYQSFNEQYMFIPNTFEIDKNNKVFPFIDNLGKPIIYISLGSIIKSRRFYRKCFSAFGEKNVQVLLTVGNIAKDSLGKVPSNFHLFEFAPQKEILSKVDLFVTHAGMNSVCEGIYYGVPMLCLPIINDQIINAKQIDRLELGKQLKFFGLKPDILYQNAHEILNRPSYKTNFLKLKNQQNMSDAITKIEWLLRGACRNKNE